ncbi:MAG: 2-hydroxyacid dehydrogenase [Aquabacterium sp.]|jgi:hydroxypyruvate reductase|uniref:2-hydroxyacid dehydrogenase n=1 Tax=Aquabacterium sp. TaxID=1872578 RepID=UPI003BB0E0E3
MTASTPSPSAVSPSGKPIVLQVGRLPLWLEQRLNDEFDITLLEAQTDRAAFLRDQGARFTGVVTSAFAGADAALINALPSLQVISNFGVGVDRIDLAAAKARGIAVGHTPDVLNDCVADVAVGLMLDVARRSMEADRFVRAGKWASGGGKSIGLGRKVSGAKLGIVGLGRIGQTIARRVSGFDMSVRYHSRNPVADVHWTHEPSLLALAEWSDFLVVIVAGGAGTRHLIDARVLQALGPRGFLVNVARGSVIDEAALVQALQNGVIAGAGLDVFDNEPHVPEALFALDNVVLLPHIASATEETREAMGDLTLDNLRGYYFDGGRLKAAMPL